ncbi:MAG TPA: hypothetical protein PKY77_13970 [Phycisphaerae bacterium]|nr:hypothetical protein [Phycisphaerae bacterium]HRY67752.1 hypothetical protein [Phycisphaerae bacterium]HSA25204.1 hypothetical protein [Phycisphaerae bacterium]
MIGGATQSPATVMAACPVWVTATVTDDRGAVAVVLTYDAGDGAGTLGMDDDGAHHDGTAGDSEYGVQIPGSACGRTVNCYITAIDYGAQTTDPASAAIVHYSYDAIHSNHDSHEPVEPGNVTGLRSAVGRRNAAGWRRLALLLAQVT